MVWRYFLAEWNEFNMKPVCLTCTNHSHKKDLIVSNDDYYAAALCWQNAWNCSRFNVCRVATNHSREELITSSMISLTESHSCLNHISRSEKWSCNQSYDSFFFFFNLGVWPSSPFLYEPAIVSAQPSCGNCVDTHKSQKAHGNPYIPEINFNRGFSIWNKTELYLPETFWGSNTAQWPVAFKYYRA